MLAKFVDHPVALFLKSLRVVASDPGGLGSYWDQTLRSWQELAGQGTRGAGWPEIVVLMTIDGR